MKKWMIGILLMLLVWPSMAWMAGEEPLTAEQKQEDVAFLAHELEEKHYDLFALVDQDQWEGRVEALREESAEMDDLNFGLGVMQLVASLGDSHTRAGLTGALKEKIGALPFQWMWFGGEVRLIATIKDYEPYLGQKLVSVAGRSIPELMESMRGFISHDNETWYRKQFLEYLIGAEYLVYLGIAQDAQNIELVFEDDAGHQTPVTAQTEYGELYNLEFVMVQRERIPLAQQAERIYYTTELDDTALMISYHSCQEDPNLPMETFVQQVEALLLEGEYEKVLVDLRYNGGGNSAVFEPMIEKLGVLRESLGYTLYAMISENTYSSALMNAVQIQMRADAILVGQPTGGSVNHYGEIVNFELPNADVMVTYSTKFFNMVPEYGTDSLHPDVVISTSFEDFMQGKDPEIEYILSVP